MHSDKYSKRPTFSRYQRDEYCPIRAGNIDGSSEHIHDRAVIRALHSNYRPNKNLTSIASHTVFVRISPKTTEETLRKFFEPIAKIVSCCIVRDIVTGMSKGYGFIEFENKDAVREVCVKMNKEIIDNFKIIVQTECGRNLRGWKPRRLGGGFGGNRNSGQLRFGGIARPFEEPSKVFRTVDDKR